jgi:RNA polymerase sigma factor (sigma-70 family)
MEKGAFLRKVCRMDGFQSTLKEFTPMIHHIIRSLKIYKNYDEFYQIGLIALWEAKEKFDPKKGSLTSYAYMTIKGRLLSELKRAARVDEQQLYPKEEFWEYRMDEQSAEPLEIEILLSYCEGLTNKQKKWVVATFYLGMSSNEIAAYENVSLSAVKKWKRGAMERMKEKVRNN